VAIVPGTAHARLVPTLEGDWYTDPARFAEEQSAIFARRWMLVARAEEISLPGSYITADVAGESVIVIRRGDAEAVGFLNVCRHRGARLLLEPRGECGRVIRCPYHSWSYSLDGTLQGAPNLREWAVGNDRETLALQRVAVHEEYGCLWVNIAGQRSFAEDIGRQLHGRLGDAGMLAGWDLARLRSGRRIVYDVAANWKLIVENFMECYHCSTIHPELVDVIPSFRSGLGSQSFGPGHGSELGPQVDGFTVDGRPGLPTLPTVPAEDARRYYGMTLTPSAFLNLVGDHAILHRIEAIAADRSRVTCEWLFAPEVLAGDHDIGPTVELFDRVNRQDFDACERCQLGAGSRAFAHGGVLVPAEHKLSVFYDEVRDALAATTIRKAVS
jgi:Rieske 2Fe-2S family protein